MVSRLSRFDYCNSVLARQSWLMVAPPLRVQKVAARLVEGVALASCRLQLYVSSCTRPSLCSVAGLRRRSAHTGQHSHWFVTARLQKWESQTLSAAYWAASKARFPLPELTARVNGLPVSITGQHGPCWRVMETAVTRKLGPSTRVVETGLKCDSANVNSLSLHFIAATDRAETHAIVDNNF